MNEIFRKKSMMVFLLIFLLGFAWMGCSSTLKEKRDETGKGEGQQSTAPRDNYFARYYYFDDVLVPGELNYKPDQSFIYETPHFKAGAMFFTKWRVDADSLITFFNYHMEKDNWNIVNSYRGKECFLSFSKPDKTCTIRILDKWDGSTQVEIRVGPLVEKKSMNQSQ